MNKTIIFFLLILNSISCEKKTDSNNNRIELKGKTFNLITESEKDTLIFDFKDSTYTVYQYSNHNRPWRLANFNKSYFLVLENRIIALKKIDDENYKGLYIGEKDTEIDILKRKMKWSKELLYGTWIEEKYFGTDSTSFPSPPILPNKWNWPPNYIINKDKIELDLYDKFESKIEINNSGEFIIMDLKNSKGLGITEELWRIKHLTDSLMIIDRTINDILLSHGEKRIENIKLIKKR